MKEATRPPAPAPGAVPALPPPQAPLPRGEGATGVRYSDYTGAAASAYKGTATKKAKAVVAST